MNTNNCLAIFLSIIVSLFSAATNARGLTTFYHTDHLGSPAYSSNDFGEVKWQETYRPYGERIDKTPPAEANDIWYTGKPHDEDIGLTYMNARYYDPVVGRFMAIDPVGFVASNLQSFNRYAYANNNPYKYVDPDGEFAFLALIPWVLGGSSAFLTGYEVGSAGYGLYSGTISAGDLAGDVGRDIAINTAVKAVPGGAALSVAKRMGADRLVEGAAEEAGKLGDLKIARGQRGAVGDVRSKPGTLGQSKGTDALRRENKMPRDAANAVGGLTKDQRKILHREISGQDLPFDEIKAIAQEIKDGLL